MKSRHLGYACALAFSAWLAIFGDKTPSTVTVEPAKRSMATAPKPSRDKPADIHIAKVSTDTIQKNENSLIDELIPREVMFGARRSEEASSTHTNGIFTSQSWTPPPAPPPPPPPPPLPSAPPLPFTYLGKKMEDGKWEVYLGRGEQTIIVHEATTISDTYRVENIKPPMLSITYLPLNKMQTLTIGGSD